MPIEDYFSGDETGKRKVLSISSSATSLGSNLYRLKVTDGEGTTIVGSAFFVIENFRKEAQKLAELLEGRRYTIKEIKD